MSSTYRVTLEDVSLFSTELEDLTNTRIHWRLESQTRRDKVVTVITLQAFKGRPEENYRLYCQATVVFPSVLYGSLAGAVLSGLMDLHKYIEAQDRLHSLGG